MWVTHIDNSSTKMLKWVNMPRFPSFMLVCIRTKSQNSALERTGKPAKHRQTRRCTAQPGQQDRQTVSSCMLAHQLNLTGICWHVERREVDLITDPALSASFVLCFLFFFRDQKDSSALFKVVNTHPILIWGGGGVICRPTGSPGSDEEYMLVQSHLDLIQIALQWMHCLKVGL